MPHPQLQSYVALWTTDREQYVLVEVALEAGRTYLDIYRRNGRYCTPSDPKLAEEVAARMRSAGVEVWDGDAWVLEQKMGPYRYLWTSPPGMLLIRRNPNRHPCGPIQIFHRDGSPVHLHEDDDVQRAVIERMCAAGVETIEGHEFPSREDSSDLERAANRWVGAEYHEWHDWENRAACQFRLVAQPSFEPWESWRLMEQVSPTGGTTRYLVRYRTWRYESPLLFHERARLPPAEQGWQIRHRQEAVRLGRDHAEEILRQLSAITLTPYVDDETGFDGTSFELTMGFRKTRLSWWEDGPEAWLELVGLLREFRTGADRRRRIEIAGC